MVGVFDRSHYEDVLIARVHELADDQEIERRYDAINDFEKKLVDDGTVVIKCMLHISAEEQRERLLARLDDADQAVEVQPRRRRRAAPAGTTTRRPTRSRWSAATPTRAPWYVVPSDRKWYRNWAVGQLLLEALQGMRPGVARARLRRRRAARAAARRTRRARTPVLKHVAATRYVTPLREGGSLPGIVEADDLGTYVCKFRGAGQGLPVLVAEVVVSELARAARPAHPAAGRPRAGAGDRPLRGRRGGPGPAQRQPRAQPRRRLPARLLRVRPDLRGRPRHRGAGCCGSTRWSPTSTAAGATPTCSSGTATSG